MEGTSAYLSQNPRTTLLWQWRAPQNTDHGRILAFPSVENSCNYPLQLCHIEEREIHLPLNVYPGLQPGLLRAPPGFCATPQGSHIYIVLPPPPKQHPHLESTFDLGNGSKTTVITPISQSQLLIWFTRPLNPGSWNPASHQHELQYVGLPSYWQGSRHFCHLTRCTQIFNSCIITSELRTYEDLIGKIKSYSTWYTWEVFVSERLSVTAINWQARIRRSNPAFFPRGYTALGSWRSIPSDRPSLSPEDCLTRVILR